MLTSPKPNAAISKLTASGLLDENGFL